MTNQILRRLEKVEELMSPPDELKFRIEVLFIGANGEVTGTRTFGSQKASEETSEDRLHD
jgi:hypothetical protein